MSTTGAETGTEPPELVRVDHEREFRGVWIATVFNIDFPPQPGLTTDAQQQTLLGLLDEVRDIGLNAIVFQVRGESDALYASDLEPWSRVLTGTQGGSPGYDPLEFAIEQAHARGLEVHAWINPYRGSVNASLPVAPNHVTEVLSNDAIPYGDLVWMDPGSEVVREHVISVALDIVERYPVDGLQMDDYFYPYRTSGPFDDGATYQAYVDSGGGLALDDWRRDNVNVLVESLHDELLDVRPDLRFGIAPFGIYRPGVPPGISGLDQYDDLFADPVLWIQEGWVDYLAPQLYWPTTQQAQAYEVLLEWWSSLPDGGRHIFAGNAAYRIGSEPAWTAEELVEQVQISRDMGFPSQGNIFYNAGALMDDLGGVVEQLQGLYARPALTPPLPRTASEGLDPPVVVATPEGALIEHEELERLRAWVLYRARGDGFVIEDVIPPTESVISVSDGRWAISAVDRYGTESLGVVVEM